MPPEAVRYCGRLFSEQELQLIRTIIAEDSSRHRFALSQVVCERLHWRRANGQLKDMSCRVAMLRMHRDGLIPLPAPRRRHSNGTLHRRRTPQAEPELPIIARVDALPALQVRPLADQREAQLWREYVDRYHYLGSDFLTSAGIGCVERLGGHLVDQGELGAGIDGAGCVEFLNQGSEHAVAGVAAEAEKLYPQDVAAQARG